MRQDGEFPSWSQSHGDALGGGVKPSLVAQQSLALHSLLTIAHFDRLGVPHLSRSPDLNVLNRLVRIRLLGGLGRAEPHGSPISMLYISTSLRKPAF